MEQVPITKEGYEALKKELEYLKKVERPKNIQAIEEARSHGDLTENAEFEAAKDRQAFIICPLVEESEKTGNVITVEDHSVYGGLGSAVAELLSQKGKARMKIMGVENSFGREGKPEEVYNV